MRPPTVGIEVSSGSIRNIPVMAWDYGGLRQVYLFYDFRS